MRETWIRSLGWEDALEKGKATHSSILAWRIPGTEEPGGLPSTGLHRIGPGTLPRLTSEPHAALLAAVRGGAWGTVGSSLCHRGSWGLEGLETPKSTSPGVYFPESSFSTVQNALTFSWSCAPEGL